MEILFTSPVDDIGMAPPPPIPEKDVNHGVVQLTRLSGHQAPFDHWYLKGQCKKGNYNSFPPKVRIPLVLK